MKTYVQFYTESTGYIPGSIPPKFSTENIKNIELLGSDGVYILDSRNSLRNMVTDSRKRAEKLSKMHKITGFKIISASSFLEDGRELYSSF